MILNHVFNWLCWTHIVSLRCWCEQRAERPEQIYGVKESRTFITPVKHCRDVLSNSVREKWITTTGHADKQVAHMLLCYHSVQLLMIYSRTSIFKSIWCSVFMSLSCQHPSVVWKASLGPVESFISFSVWMILLRLLPVLICPSHTPLYWGMVQSWSKGELWS